MSKIDGDTIGAIWMLIVVVFVVTVLILVAIQLSIQNDFCGNIEVYAYGVYAVEVDKCFRNDNVYSVGEVNISRCAKYYKKPLAGVNAGESLGCVDNFLVEGHHYIIYEKNYKVIWDFRSYFMECVE